MIKDRLLGTIQPAEMGILPGSDLHYEIFRLLTQPELLNPEGFVDRSNAEVIEFFKLLTPLMVHYVKPGAEWDLIDVIANPAENADETIVISDPQGTVRAVGNLELKLNDGIKTIGMEGMVVDPELRGGGITSWVLSRAAELYQPEMFQGSTNSEIAALSCALVLRKYGYTSFIGGQPITSPEQPELSPEALREKVYAWLRAHDYEHPEDGHILVRKAPYPNFKPTDRTDRRPSAMSDAEWANLKRVFDAIVQEQAADPAMLVQAPLNSIK